MDIEVMRSKMRSVLERSASYKDAEGEIIREIGREIVGDFSVTVCDVGEVRIGTVYLYSPQGGKREVRVVVRDEAC